jgi:hypothetical protein
MASVTPAGNRSLTSWLIFASSMRRFVATRLSPWDLWPRDLFTTVVKNKKRLTAWT